MGEVHASLKLWDLSFCLHIACKSFRAGIQGVWLGDSLKIEKLEEKKMTPLSSTVEDGDLSLCYIHLGIASRYISSANSLVLRRSWV